MLKEEKYYFVYIATNHPRYTVLYTGITNNIFERQKQHEYKINKNSFTARYNINRVVHYETYNESIVAIGREKQIKSWSRQRKERLIDKYNPEWKDMIEESLK